MYVSKHWSTKEWDCLNRSENEFAFDNENGRLCTNDERTANLFRILDMLRDWNPDWVVNTTNAGYKSGYRNLEVNAEVGGEENSLHTQGCAADIHITSEDATDEALADTVLAAAEAWGLSDKLGIGCYGDWIHIDTRGYTARW